MTAASRFAAFLANIRPTGAQIEDARTKLDDVARTLHNYYYEDPFTGETARLIGSYGKGTAVRPPRDVDILFVLPNILYQRYSEYESNGPSQLLQDVKNVLKDHYSTTDKIRGDAHVVVIPFSGGHNVELLPAWRTTTGKYLVPDSHDGGIWRLVDQTAEMVNVDASNILSDGASRDLIMMLKVWQHECTVPIKSLALELHVVDLLSDAGAIGGNYSRYPELLQGCFAQLTKSAGRVDQMPGTGEPFEFGDVWASKADSAAQRAARACDHEAAGNERAAAVEWKKVFGPQYEY
jgi:hypothetical protein